MLVDKAGKPVVFYHGTNVIFGDFQQGIAGELTGAPSAMQGFFFTTNPKMANLYARTRIEPTGATTEGPPGLLGRMMGRTSRSVPVIEMLDEGGHVRPTYLRMTDPHEVSGVRARARAAMKADIAQRGRGVFTNVMHYEELIQQQEIAAAKAAGKDGVIFRDVEDLDGIRGDVYVPFDATTQIRGLHQRYDVPGAHVPQTMAELYGRDAALRREAAEGREIAAARRAEKMAAQPKGPPSDEPVVSSYMLREHEDPHGIDRLGDLDADTLPVGQVVTNPQGHRWKVAELEIGNRYFSLQRDATPLPKGDLATGTPGFLDGTGSEGPVVHKPMRLVDMEFVPGELPRAEASLGKLEHNIPHDESGSRELVLNGESRSAAEFPVGHMIETPNGELWRVNDVKGVNRFELWGETKPHPEGTGPTSERTGVGLPPAQPGEQGSVGAALSPQSLVYQREVLLAQGRMAPTGIGMERWPLTPLHRLFMGESVEAMRAAGDLVATGGSITMGNKQGIGSAVPVETLIQSNWEHMALSAVRGMKDDWAESRHAAAAAAGANAGTPVDFSGRSDIRKLGAEVGDAIKRKFSRGEAGLSYNQFLQRVTEGLRNGDADRVADGSTPFVERAIARHRSVYETTKARMIEAGVFDEAYEAAKFDAYAGVRAVQKDMKEIANRANIERWPADRQRLAEEALMARLEDAEFKAKQTEDQLSALRQHGPQLNGTAPSYAPRLWDAGALKRGEEHFIADIAVPWLMKEGGINDTLEATRIAKEMHTLLSRQNPVFERADVKNLFHSVAAPGSAMARTFTIPDELVKEFLIDDAELLLRYHVKQNAVAVEMKRRFGSMDMAEQIAAVEQEYRGQIIAANAGSDVPTEEAVRLVKLMKSDIADLQALRDKLYGTYGAAADPHAWDSRLIRMAKQFANITLLGGSGVSSLGDFVRPLMTEGLEAMYGYGLRSLMSDMRGTILKLGKEDMQLAGVGSDLMNNVRALQAADTGDVFGSRGRLEHGLNQANQWMFVLNGLNQITEWSKNWANIIIQGKMNKAIMQWGTVGAQELPEVPTGMVRVWHGGKLNPNDLGRCRYTATSRSRRAPATATVTCGTPTCPRTVRGLPARSPATCRTARPRPAWASPWSVHRARARSRLSW